MLIIIHLVKFAVKCEQYFTINFADFAIHLKSALIKFHYLQKSLLIYCQLFNFEPKWRNLPIFFLKK